MLGDLHDPQPEGGEAGGEAGGEVVKTLTKDEFYGAFRGLVAAPNILIAPPLESLKIQEGDAQARAASDAIYDTAIEVPWLRFLIQPSNVWLQRALVVGAFGMGLSNAVTAELHARKPKPDTHDQPQSEAANDEGPGRDQGIVTLEAGR